MIVYSEGLARNYVGPVFVSLSDADFIGGLRISEIYIHIDKVT